MCQVLSSAREAEVGATFYGCKDAAPLRNTLSDLGHVQGATLIITDNECCEVIKQHRQAKTVEGHGHALLLGEVQNCTDKFKLLWRSGRENLADYFTKMHAQVHHKNIRPLYVISSLTSRGCNKGVFIGTKIPYVPFVLSTSNSNRLKHIRSRTITAQPKARTQL